MCCVLYLALMCWCVVMMRDWWSIGQQVWRRPRVPKKPRPVRLSGRFGEVWGYLLTYYRSGFAVRVVDIGLGVLRLRLRLRSLGSRRWGGGEMRYVCREVSEWGCAWVRESTGFCQQAGKVEREREREREQGWCGEGSIWRWGYDRHTLIEMRLGMGEVIYM